MVVTDDAREIAEDASLERRSNFGLALAVIVPHVVRPAGASRLDLTQLGNSKAFARAPTLRLDQGPIREIRSLSGRRDRRYDCWALRPIE